MFARIVGLHLKQNSSGEFTAVFEDEAVPLPRQQQGFQHVMTLITPDGDDVIALGLWSNKADAEAYHLQGYGAILERLAEVLDGSPQVKTYEVCNSTMGSAIPAAVAGAQS
jgi:hypothetical protein